MWRAMKSPRLLKIDPSRDHITGSASAPIQLILYSEYTCPHARAAHQIDLRLHRKIGKSAVLAHRQYPSAGATSELAARAALAAGMHGKFWEAHKLLFEMDPAMPDTGFVDLAISLGIDPSTFASDMQSDAVSRQINEDIASARRAKVAGSPALFVNGFQYHGAWDDLSIAEEIGRPLGVILRSASERFYRWAASAGLVLVLATLAALIFVNVGYHETYERWRDTELTLSLGGRGFSLSLEAWINDGLMAVFFLLVGIEIKREILYGELSSLSNAMLPLIGAVGGMVVPVIIFLSINAGLPTAGGWGIPMATDIAFTLGLIALLGSRVPLTIKVFVSALAIADDLGAILVIAIFYGHGFDPTPLIWASAILGVMLCLNKIRIYSRMPYVLLAIVLWFFVHESGLHATLAGVLTAALIPSRQAGNLEGVAAQTAQIFQLHKGAEMGSEGLKKLRNALERLREPGYHLQHQLEGWSNFLILPLFAFFNTGVLVSGGGSTLQSPVSLGIILGLAAGKPLGICIFCWVAVRTGVASLSDDVNWTQMIAAGCLAGVGFTMSIFIATSAFEGELLNSVKLSVLIGSVAAAIVGVTVMLKATQSDVEDKRPTSI